MEKLIWIIGAVSWWSTALVYKAGPFNIFKRFKEWTFERLGKDENDAERSPLACSFCTGPYVLVPILILSSIAPVIVQVFGILGFAAAVRGLSNEY